MNEAVFYQVKTEFFAGPLDLLLHLIRKKKMDILEIRISDITADYLQYLEHKECLDPARESDFLATAATLVYIKARTMLPRLEEENEETAESRLIQALIAYDKIQKIAGLLRGLEEQETRQWRRREQAENFADREYVFTEVSSFQLAETFFALVRKKDSEQALVLTGKNYSIEAKWQEIIELVKASGGLDFTAYIWKLDSLEDVLVSFFTLLEMIKRRVVVAVQRALFEPINIWLLPDNGCLQ